MPLIDAFDGIKIYIYGREHRPPHIHVYYGEFEILIIIETRKTYAGRMPIKKKKMALDWLSKKSEWALNVYFLLNPELR